MKIGFRKPSPRRSLRARTTGKMMRSAKRTINPVYGKKGVGYIKNPSRAIKNSIYHKTTVGIGDSVIRHQSGTHSNASWFKGTESSEWHVNSSNLDEFIYAATSSNRTAMLKYTLLWIFLLVFLFITLPRIYAIMAMIIVTVSWIFLLVREQNIINELAYDIKKQADDQINEIENSSEKNGYVHREEPQKRSDGKQYYRKDYADKHNNMNCDIYRFSGKYVKTGRMRTNKFVNAFQDEDVLEAIKKEGYDEPIKYEYVPWPEMSDAQRRYLYDVFNGKFQTNMSTLDASAMLDRYEQHVFKAANMDLFKHAEMLRIPVSYFCSYKTLKTIVCQNMKGKELLAFYVYSVDCERSGNEAHNILDEENKNLYYGFDDYAKETCGFDACDRMKNRTIEDWYDKRTKLYQSVKKYLEAKTSIQTTEKGDVYRTAIVQKGNLTMGQDEVIFHDTEEG